MKNLKGEHATTEIQDKSKSGDICQGEQPQKFGTNLIQKIATTEHTEFTEKGFFWS